MAVAVKEYIFSPNGKWLNMETTKANNARIQETEQSAFPVRLGRLQLRDM